MPRGVYERKPAGEVSTMTVDEIQAAEERIKDQVSPLPAPKGATGQIVTAPDGFQRQRVGNFVTPAQLGDSSTLRHFAAIPRSYEGWIEMTPEQARDYEKQRLLADYDADKGMGLLARKPSPLPQKRVP